MTDRTMRPEVRREVQELSLLFEISQVLDRSLDLRESVHPSSRRWPTTPGCCAAA